MVLEQAAKAAAKPTPLPDRTAAVFVAIIFIVILARLLGRLFRRIGQPPVIGEILAGILLGTSLLGQFHSGHRTLTTVLFPADVTQILKAFANLGLVIFMFIIGLELDLKLIKGNERRAGVISLSSVIVPFVGGALLALALYHDHSQGGLAPGGHVKKLAFALFIGASMCVTAFPVLARILNERGMTRTPLGVIALACAAIDDVVAWSLLAVVSAIAGYTNSPLWEVLAYSALYLAVMFGVVRPLLARYLVPLYHKAGRLTPDVLAFLLVGLILSAWTTDHIGIHFIFGAFVFGLVVPREGTEMLFAEILERLEQVSVLLLLPIFFIVSGLSVDLTQLTGKVLGEMFAVLAVAIGGKFIGAYLAARAQGIPNRRSQALGLLMNTRGLTELILLSVGLKLKVLDVQLFTMLVVMAIVTTVMTAPLLKLVYPDRIVAKEVEEAEREALGIPNAYRVVVVLGEVSADAPLVSLAGDLAASERPAQVVLSLLRQQNTAPLEVGSGLSTELAEMAGVMGELEVLAEQVRGRGIDCVVLSRFSADLTADAVSQIASANADLVLVSPTAAIDHDRFLAAVQVTVAVWDGAAPRAAGGPVSAVAHGGDAADAAIALGVRIAAVRGETLTLIDDGSRRRIAGLIERLDRLGVHAQVVGPEDAVDELVALEIDAPAPFGCSGLLRVRPSLLTDQSELAALIDAGIVAARQPAANAASVPAVPTV
jgi:Kef-type K+ transport system membrane component KefB